MAESVFDNIISYFNFVVVAKCTDGQKKYGVEDGGKYICENLNINPSVTIEKNLFDNINKQYQNGYEILSNMLISHSLLYPNEHTLLIGGDHSLGISSVDFMIEKYKEKLSVLWIDAHADINDHITSLSGNLHGMPLGYHHISRSDTPHWRKNQYRLKSTQLYYFGIRDIDPAEMELIEKENIGYSNKIDINLKKFIDDAEILMISFDVDALDPTYLDSTGCLAPDGLTPEDVKYIIKYSIQKNKLKHLDIMEFNPHLGNYMKSINVVKQIFL